MNTAVQITLIICVSLVTIVYLSVKYPVEDAKEEKKTTNKKK